MRNRKRGRPTPQSAPAAFQQAAELVEFLESLPRVKAGENGYTETDRARDFIAVFRGTSTAEQGERVFSQIKSFCEPAPDARHADMPGLLAFKEGQRAILAQIKRCFEVAAPVQIQRSYHDRPEPITGR